MKLSSIKSMKKSTLITIIVSSVLAIALIVGLIVGLTQCEAEIEVEKISLSQTALTLKVGEEATLTVAVTPEDADDKTVTWASSDAAIASVTNGKVVAVKEGTATITATTANGKAASCSVTVVAKDHVHTPATAVVENEVKATCTTDGTHDEVTYCTSCHGELDRKNVVTPATGHTEVSVDAVEATCTATGKTAGTKCSVCDTILAGLEEVPMKEHDYTLDYGKECSVCHDRRFEKTLVYKLKADGTYAVKAGPDVNNVSIINIPVTYEGIKVTTVLENAFANCSRLVQIRIPNTVTLIGVGAFSGCSRLENIEVYNVEGTESEEKFYSSDDGALIRYDSGITYLELCPPAKTGEYVMSNEVQVIRNKAFNRSKLTNITIGAGVTTVASQAFYYCTALEAIDFDTTRTISATFEEDSFYRCTGVESIFIPKTLTDLNITMLQSLTNLTEIVVEEGHVSYGSVDGLLTNNVKDTIVFAPAKYVSGDFVVPFGIQNIGDRAFERCAGLTSVTVPNYVKSIGLNAFNGCTGIKNVTVAAGRNNDLTIGDYAFAGCNALATVIFSASEDGTTDAGKVTIGAYAFAPASGLNANIHTIKFGKGANIALIGDHAFAGQTLLSEVDFGEATVAAIGNYTFYGDTNIKNITIPATMTSVGSYAFAECTGITALSIAEGSTSLSFGSYCFTGCVKLQTINLPSTVSKFDGSVFGGCSAIKEIIVDPANVHFKSVDGILYNADVTELIFYPNAIVVNKDGKINDLPATLKVVGPSVFENNVNIKEISLGKGITAVGARAFYGALNLSVVTFDKTATDITLIIGDSAFVNCAIAAIDLPAYTTEIGTAAFQGCKLASFTVPAGVTVINSNTFKGNKSLKTITVAAAVTSIGDGAFNGCSGLTDLVIEGGDVELTIGTDSSSGTSTGAFYGTKLTTLVLPDRVTKIGGHAFRGVTTLTTFIAGKNLQSIGTYAFYGCSNLATLEFNEGLKTIGTYAFQNDKKFTTLTIPSTVTAIGSYAFGSGGYKTLTFAPGGTDPITLGNYAFRYATITSVTLPARAVAYDRDLDPATYTPMYTPWTTSGTAVMQFTFVFYDCKSLENIYVEEGSKSFKSIDGILYTLNENGDAETLLYCPEANKGKDGTGVVTIPKTVRIVEHASFYNTKNLKEVIFEEYDKADENYGKQLLYIGYLNNGGQGSSSEAYGVFCGTANTITKVSVPSHLAFIGSGAFRLKGSAPASAAYDYNHDVQVIFNLDASGITIESWAFYNLDAQRLDLPSIAKFGYRSQFAYMTVEYLTIAKGSTVETFPYYCVFTAKYLKEFEFPASIKTLDTMTFMTTPALEKVTFEEGSQLETISGQVFNGSGVKEFTFPDTVLTVPKSVFYNCPNLTVVNLPKSMASFSGQAFTGTTTNVETLTLSDECLLYVVEENVVYDRAKTGVFYYAPTKTDKVYTLPETVISIEPYAFAGFKGDEVILPAVLETISDNAFYESQLKQITIPAKVTQIGASVFYNNTLLKKVTMDKENGSVKSIGNNVFQNCESLEEITLCDSIESSGYSAFSNCTSLKSVTVPKSLKETGSSMFYGCGALEEVILQEGLEVLAGNTFAMWETNSKLKSIHIPSTVKEIKNAVFQNQVSLETVTFADDSLLEGIGNSAFSGCSSLKSIDFSKTTALAFIGTTPFNGCTALTNVDLSSTAIEDLSNNAFNGCSALTSVTLPSTTVTIGNNAFKGTSIVEFTIPASVTSIGASAFEDCAKLETVIFADGSALVNLGTASAAQDNIFKNTTSLKKVVLPTSLEMIGGHVFENSAVSEIDLPATLTSVGNYAFANCDNLKVVALYANVTYIGDYAFYDCASLETAELSDGLKYVGALAFAYCQKLQATFIPETVTILNGNPYAGCLSISITISEYNTAYKLAEDGILYDSTMYTLVCFPASKTDTSVTFSEDVHEIAAGAFAGTQLVNVTLPNTLKTIPDYAFAKCLSLETISIPNSVTSIGNNAFEGCAALNNVTIPTSVNTFGDYVFANCTALSSFTFEEKNTATDSPYKLGTHFFDGCTSITEIIIPGYMSGSKLPDYMFANTSIVTAVIPESINDLLSEGVFYGCKKLETATFLGFDFSEWDSPSNTEYDPQTIGNYFFYGCESLTTVIDGVEETPDNKMGSIGAYSFAGCKSLTTFGLYPMETVIRAHAFDGCTGLTTFTFASSSRYAPDSWKRIEEYAFAGCTNIKNLYIFGPYDDQTEALGTNIFDGWTKDQTIYFVNLQSDFYELYWSMVSDTMFDGCEATVWFKDTLMNQETAELPFFTTYISSELAGYKAKVFKVGAMLDDASFHAKKVFDGWTNEQSIYFTGNTYEEIIAKLGQGIFMGCGANVYDMNGNVLIIDSATGAITQVKDASGNVIFDINA